MEQQTLQIVKKPFNIESISLENHQIITTPEHAFVASKRGKYYYPKSCNKAQSLSIKNMLYFKDKMSAEQAGFIAFSGCF